MNKKSGIAAFRFWARNWVSRDVFRALRRYCAGDVLDIGGRDFFEEAVRRGATYRTWVNVEYEPGHLQRAGADAYYPVIADGCRLPFGDSRFDTVLSIQVLEHVMEPLKMIEQIARVLKSGGTGIFLLPQTSVLHELPRHYGNFTRYWVKEAMARNGLEIVELVALGGRWSSSASHFLHMFFQIGRADGLSAPEFKRNVWFYLLCPFMILYALVSIPVCLLLSLGDLTEEPNNHLVVVRKPS